METKMKIRTLICGVALLAACDSVIFDEDATETEVITEVIEEITPDAVPKTPVCGLEFGGVNDLGAIRGNCTCEAVWESFAKQPNLNSLVIYRSMGCDTHYTNTEVLPEPTRANRNRNRDDNDDDDDDDNGDDD